MRAWVIVALVSACVQSNTLICRDGHLCPSDKLCDEIHGGCVLAEQKSACDGAADATMCMYRGEPIGFCKDGVCFASSCGDGIVTAPEQCDGAITGATCLDRGFYFPDGLTCDPLTCEYDTSGCQGSCGDRGLHLLNGPEACDGSPPASTCTGLGFGMGVIGCSGACGPDLVGCRTLGLEPVPSPFAGITGVWAASNARAFAVGPAGAIAGYDGQTWTAMTSGTTADLARVWGASATDVYAVGAGGTLLHYDGSAWSAIASGVTVDLFGVWGSGASDVFVVGDLGTILHFDGSAWSPMTSGSGSLLRGVWGSGPTDVYVVGQIGQNVLHYNGTWSAQLVLPAAGSYADVWGSAAGDVYAAGINNAKTATILHLSGGTWTDVTPTPRPSGPLRAVWGTSAQDVFVVGAGGEVMHYSGTTWRTVERVPQALSALGGGDSAHVWIGGDTLFGFRGTAEIASPMATAAGFARGVSARPNGEVFVVGDESIPTAQDQIHHFKNGAWATEPSGIGSTLRSVWLVGTTNAIAVGQGDGTHDMVVYSSVSGTWSVLASSPSTHLFAIWGTPTEAFAVGESGAVLHTQNGGQTWAASTVTGASFRGVWGASTSDVFAVGTGGVIFHYDGFWTQMTSPVGVQLDAVSGTSGSDVYAVGAAGTLLHYDGATWSMVPVPVSTDLLAVSNGPGDDLFIGGNGGVFLHRVDGVWVPIDATAVLSVEGIANAGHSVYAAGASTSLLELYRTTLAPGAETACENYWDDDGNGLIDACDPACAGRGPAEQCANDFDDDCDGLVDCADPDCAHDPSCN